MLLVEMEYLKAEKLVMMEIIIIAMDVLWVAQQKLVGAVALPVPLVLILMLLGLS